jgi:hypothetical protein
VVFKDPALQKKAECENVKHIMLENQQSVDRLKAMINRHKQEYLECMENYQAEKMAGGNPLHCTDLTPADEMGLILVQAHLDQGKRVYAGASCSDFE